MNKAPRQFDWRRHWKKKVEPHLQKDAVQFALNIGMRMLTPLWKSGDPPYQHGRIEGGRVVKGKLSWYRPFGGCHSIAFFSMAIGVINYPSLDWRFISGELHTVPVGFGPDDMPKVVMDILLYDGMTAAQSLELTKMKPVRAMQDQIGAAQHKELHALFLEKCLPSLRACVEN